MALVSKGSQMAPATSGFNRRIRGETLLFAKQEPVYQFFLYRVNDYHFHQQNAIKDYGRFLSAKRSAIFVSHPPPTNGLPVLK